ncbi:MAG: Cna B-type domain-containing protein [Oscillospiraceae bacterium]|nr:Cna B-type domain-containing protein [Oscillospiraceae bacterium]
MKRNNIKHRIAAAWLGFMMIFQNASPIVLAVENILEEIYAGEDAGYVKHDRLVKTYASDDRLLDMSELEEETINIINGGITAIADESEEPDESKPSNPKTPPAQEPETKDGVTINNVYLRWVSSSYDEDDPAYFGDLELRPDGEKLPNQQFQLDFSLSGQQSYEPGEIEITFPAWLWEDRAGEECGTLSLSVPEDPDRNVEFAWKRVGDTIVITNVKKIESTSKIMLQGTFSNVASEKIADDAWSKDFSATVTVKTPNGDSVSMKSNEIKAHVDTYIEVDEAYKTAYNTTAESYDIWWGNPPDDMPKELLGALPDGADPKDYGYIRWYVAATAKGSQPFDMYIEDTVETEHNGIMLGVSNCADSSDLAGGGGGEGVYYVRSTDGKTVKARLYAGYSLTAKTAYVWTAYKRDDFPEYLDDPSKMTEIKNTHTISVIGKDDGETDSKDSNEAKVETRKPVTYRFEKLWVDDNDSRERRPGYMDLEIKDGKDSWSTVRMNSGNADPDDPNKWVYEWTDNGEGCDFSLSEKLYNYSGNIDEWYGDKIYRHRWFYALSHNDLYKEKVYDPETNTYTWVFPNLYLEQWDVPIISGLNKTVASVYDDGRRASKRDNLSLNKVLLGDTVYVPYTIKSTISAAAEYLDENLNIVDSDEPFRFVLEDSDYYFTDQVTKTDYKNLTTEDIDIGYVDITNLNAYIYKDPKEIQIGTTVVDGKEEPVYRWAYNHQEITPRPPVTLYGKIGDEWIELAKLNWDSQEEILTAEGAPYKGVGVSDNRVNLPKGVSGVKFEVEAHAAFVQIDGTVGMRVYPSDQMKSRIQKSLEYDDEDYILFTLRNTSNSSAYGEDKTKPMEESERSSSANAHMHGREFKVAAELDKKFYMHTTENDVVNRRVVLHSELELTQQSNITSPSDYAEVLADGGIPNAKSGVYYDLLPVGVEVDLSSIEVSEGDRVINAWTVRNYKGTGRTLLCVQVELTDRISYANPNSMDKTKSDKHPDDENYPVEGYKNTHTLKFKSYLSWDTIRDGRIDLDDFKNVAAFDDDADIIGNVKEWSGGDGQSQKDVRKKYPDLNNLDDILKPQENSSFVMAGDQLEYEEINMSAKTGLTKSVQADDFGSGGSADEVNIQEDGLYTYKLTIASSFDTVTNDIILFDSIENYTPSGDDADAGDKWQWNGHLVSVDTDAVEKQGAYPVVYYSTVPQLDLSSYGDSKTDSTEIMVERLQTDKKDGALVWSTTVPENMSEVTAIAVCLYADEDHSKFFELKANSSLSIYLHMRAPYEDDADYLSKTGDITDPGNNAHAYNRAHVSYVQTTDTAPEGSYHYAPSNYTKVGIFSNELKIVKVWEDDNNRDGVRPETIKIYLEENGNKTEKYVILSDENDWKDSFKKLKIYDDDGKPIKYTCSENPEDFTYSGEKDPDKNYDYNLTISNRFLPDGNMEITLTNKHNPEKISIPLRKVWDDNENAARKRPSSVIVELYANGVFTGRTYTLYGDSWEGTFVDLPKYENGEEIVYALKEQYVDDYIEVTPAPKADGDGTEAPEDDSVWEFVNKYYPYGMLSVTKHIVNATNAAADKKFTFELRLTTKAKDGGEDRLPVTDSYNYVIYDSDGKKLSEGTIGDGGTFTIGAEQKFVIEKLPTHIQYTVTELPTAGFNMSEAVNDTGEIVSYAASEAEFTNTYSTKGTASIAAKKTINGRVLESAQFRFNLKLVESCSPDGETIPGDNKLIRTAYNDAGGSVSFGQITYGNDDDGWTYVYEITEENTQKSGYTYDNSAYRVKVTVSDNGNGTMKCAVTYIDKDGNEIPEAEMPENEKFRPEFINEYHAERSLTLRAWKSIDGGSLASTDKFDFDLYRREDGKPKVEWITSVQNNESGVIDFENLKFTEADAGKTYWFYICERKGSDERFIYSEEIIGYRVTVTDNGDGTLGFSQDTYIIPEKALHKCEGCDGSGTVSGGICGTCGGFGYTANIMWKPPTENDSPQIVNGLKDGSLSISKVIEGSGDTDTEFSFTVKLIGDKIESKLEANENIIEYTIDGVTHTSEVNDDGEFIIKLKGGEKALIEDLPAGTIFQISETDIPNGWDVVSQDNPSGSIEAITESKAIFTNRYDPNVTSVSFIGFKYLDGTTAEEGRFTFDLFEVDKFEKPREETYLGEAVTERGGLIRFRTIEYEKEGTYYYIVRESSDVQDPNITYDDHEEQITVVVTTGNNGALHAKVTYSGSAGSSMQFNNTTKSGGLTISKIAEVFDKNKDTNFKFKINFYDESGPISGDEFEWTVKDGDGNVIKSGMGSENIAEEKVSEETYSAIGDDLLITGFGMGGLMRARLDEPQPEAVDYSALTPMNMLLGIIAGQDNEMSEDIAVISNEDDGIMPLADEVISADAYTPPSDEILANGKILRQDTYNYSSTVSGVTWKVIETGRTITVYDTNNNGNLTKDAAGNMIVVSIPERVLLIEPTNGIEGTLGSGWDNAPNWNNGNYKADNSAQVTTVIIKDRVYTPNGGVRDGGNNNLAQMFQGFRNLVYADLRGLDASRTNRSNGQFKNIFTNCVNLRTAIFGGEDKSVRAINDVKNIFSGCTNLTNIEVFGIDYIENYDLDLNSTFYYCSSVKTIDVSKWKFGSAKTVKLDNLFSGCTSLEYLNISGWDVSKVTSTSYMFNGCSSLRRVTLDASFYDNAVMPVLPTPPTTGGYTGKWVLESQAGYPFTKQDYAYTPQELKTNMNNGSAPSGTYVWQRGSYTIEFDKGEDGASGYMTDAWSYSDEVYNIPNCKFTYPGYVFVGWKAEGSDIIYPQNGVIPANRYGHGESVKLVAQWVSEDDESLIRFNAKHYLEDDERHEQYADGDLSTIAYKDPETVLYRQLEGTTVTIYPNQYKGYVALDTAKTVKVAAGMNDIEFRYRLIRYTVHFDGNGADGVTEDDGSVTEGGTMEAADMVGNVKQTLTNRYTKNDNIFLGWNTQPDGSGDWYSASSAIENIAGDGETITLYAQWLPVGESITGHTGKEIIITCKAGETIEFSDLPAGIRYEIEEIDNPSGWNVDEYGGYAGTVPADGCAAAHVKNVYSAKGDAVITAHKQLRDASLTSGAFAFELSDDESFSPEHIIDTKSNGEVDRSIGSYEEDGSLTPNPWYGTASVIFDQLTFTTPGEYIYYIREKIPGESDEGYDPTMDYDESVVQVIVTVTDEYGNGTLTTKVDYFDSDTPITDGGALFENSIKTGILSVSKTVENASGDVADYYFTFNVTLKDAEGNPLSGDYEYALKRSDSAADGDETGRKTITIDEGKGSFSIKGGETIVIYGLPDGATYTVEEIQQTNFTIKSRTGDTGTIKYDDPDAAHAEFTNYYSSDQLRLTAKKNFVGGELEDGMFEFELLEEFKPSAEDEGSGEDSGESSDGGSDEIMGVSEDGSEDENIVEIKGTKYRRLETVGVDRNGMISFTPIDILGLDFTETHEYHFVYYIREVIPLESGGIWYDTDLEQIDVYVTQDSSGQMNIIMRPEEHSIEFVNYALYDLEVSKTVPGIFADTDEEFNFVLTLDNGAVGFPEGMMYTTVSDSSGESESQKLVLEDGKFRFKLKADEKIIFKNLPYGTTYKIEEAKNDDYRPSITVIGDDGAVISEGTINSTIPGNNISVEYENTRIPKLPTTGGRGVMLFGAGGSVLLAMAALLFIYRKRREMIN